LFSSAPYPSPPRSFFSPANPTTTTMRKFWFAIIDIVLLMAISYAESDGKTFAAVVEELFIYI
jgi:hypothetical protein